MEGERWSERDIGGRERKRDRRERDGAREGERKRDGERWMEGGRERESTSYNAYMYPQRLHLNLP